jgi:hypothetical protein
MQQDRLEETVMQRKIDKTGGGGGGCTNLPKMRAVSAVVPEERLTEASSDKAWSACRKDRLILLSTDSVYRSSASDHRGKSPSSKRNLTACLFMNAAASAPPCPSKTYTSNPLFREHSQLSFEPNGYHR